MFEETNMENSIPPMLYKGYRLLHITKDSLDSFKELKEKLAGEDPSVNKNNSAEHMVRLVDMYDGTNNQGYLITNKGEVVGDLFFLDLTPGRDVFVTSFNLLPEHRSKGIGTGIMNNLIELAKQKRCTSVRLGVGPDNDGAERFYRRLGFKVLDRRMNKDDVMYMQKLLDDRYNNFKGY